MKTICLSLLLLADIACGTAIAQTIQGKVCDTTHQPIEGAGIVLLTPDSTFLDAVLTDSCGIFAFNRQADHFRLIVQHMLYHTVEKECSDTSVGEIILQPQDYELNEVVIKSERPLVRAEGDRLIYDIGQLTAEKLATNAYEALIKVPGIIEQDGRLMLAGAGAAHLLLDGRPSSMTYEQVVAVLRSTPVSQLEKVEVMYTTPPQYHVRGASVNILLRKSNAEENSLQGEITGNYIQQREAGGGGGLSLTYTASKFSTDFMYHADNAYSRFGNQLTTHHTVREQVYDIRQATDGSGRDTKHLFRLGGLYQIDDKNSLDASYTASITPNSSSQLSASGNLFQSQNSLESQTQVHNVAVNYVSGFGSKIGLDYTHYSDRETQTFANQSNTESTTDFTSRSRQLINRWKVFADQSHTLSSSWTLNYGLSFSYVNNRNRQLYDSQEMQALNNERRIDEYTYQLYGGIQHSFSKKSQLSLSATVEYYKMAEEKKWAVYPVLQWNYIFAPAHILQLAFSSDKTYPAYWVLSGTSSYLNSYQVSIGNDELKPYTDYTGSLTYICQQKYIFRISYSHKANYFKQLAYLSPTELKVIYNYHNWDYSRQLDITSVIPFRKLSWWKSQLLVSLMLKHDKASHYFDAPFDNRRWIGIGMWDNTFILSQAPDIRLEVSAFGQTKAIQGSYLIRPLGGIDAAIRYTFMKGNAMIQLKVDDLFDSRNPCTEIRNGIQQLSMENRNYERALTLSFSYKFKGYKEKEREEVDTSRFGF